jgi:hypothetical protein
MKTRVRFPLLARVLAWLCLHLVILALCFFLFVRWQLGLGLDSLLSGSAGDRLAAFGDNIVSKIVRDASEGVEWGNRVARRGEGC